MPIMDQANHRAPLVVDRDGKSFTSNRINPNDVLKLCGNVTDGDQATADIHAYAVLFKILSEFNGEGQLEFQSGNYILSAGNPLRFPQVKFIKDINAGTWGAIRWNFDLTPARFQYTNDQGTTWVDFGSGSGGSSNKISRIEGVTEYKLEIESPTGDSVLSSVTGGVTTPVMRLQQNGTIVFTSTGIQMMDTNSQVDFESLIANIQTAKQLSIFSLSWQVGADGVATGLTTRGGYTKDIP